MRLLLLNERISEMCLTVSAVTPDDGESLGLRVLLDGVADLAILHARFNRLDSLMKMDYKIKTVSQRPN